MGLNRGRGTDQVPAHQTFRKTMGATELVPAKFRRLVKLTQLHERVQADYSFPTALIAGRLYEDLHQERENAEAILTTIDQTLGTGAPLLSYRRTRDLQLETVTESLVPESSTPPALTGLTYEMEQEALGDGNATLRVGLIPSIFPAQVYRESRPIVTPEVFRARLQEFGFDQSLLGSAVDPGPLPVGVIEQSDTQTDSFTHRTTIRSLPIINLPVTVTDFRTSRQKQIETVARTLELDTTTPLTPSATQDTTFNVLGDGTAVQEVVSVPSVFPEQIFRESRPIVTPEVFRALLQETGFDQTLAGTAADPGVLPAGVIEQSDTQVTAFTHRTTSRAIPIISLPRSIIDSRTNRDRQVETVTRILELDSTTPALPTGLMEVDFTKLGDGTAVEERRTIPSVFPRAVYRESRPIVTPEVFRARLQETSFDQSLLGTAADPGTLLPGVIEQTDTQVDLFTHRTTIRSLPIVSLPVTVTDFRTSRYKQVQTVARTLELDSVLPATPDATHETTFNVLGDGTAVQEVISVPSVFPEAVYRESRPIVTPEVFRALLQESGFDQTLPGTAADPGVLGAGIIEQSDTQIDLFTHRTTQRSIPTVALPVTVTEYRTSRVKQIETVTRTLELASSTPLTPSATQDTTFDVLGDGTAVQQVISVPSVFPEQVYRESRPIVTPEVFRALLQETSFDQTLPGTAADPGVLAPGVIEQSDTQITAFTHRTTRRAIPIVSLPATITGSRTNRYKQVETLTRILELDSTTPAAPTALLEVTFTKLGDGTAIEEQTSIPSLFPNKSTTTELSDVVPLEFRAVIPTYETETRITGTIVDPPVLSPGDLRKTEIQDDVFNKRVLLRTRAGVVLPQVLVNKETTTQYGGGDLDTVLTLDLIGNLTLDEGLTFVSSEVKNIGAGLGLKSTRQLHSGVWLPVASRLWDENMWLEYDETQTVVAAGTAEDPNPGVFGWVSEIRGIDKWKSRKVNVSKPTPIYFDPVSALITYEYRPYRFPGYLYRSTNGYYVRSAHADLCQQKIRTWWVSSVNPPPPPAVDQIIMDNPIISTLNDVTSLAYAGECLHDNLLTFNTFLYPATTPSATQYTAGTPDGTVTTHNFALLQSPGTTGGSFIGQTIPIVGGGFSMVIQVTSVYNVPGGANGLINGWTNVTGNYPAANTLYGPFNAGGASWSVWAVSLPNYVPGTAWIGSEKVIAATITREREKNVWKYETRSVVMR